MRTYILRRLLLNVPVILLIVGAVFIMIRVTPNDVVQLMLQDAQVSGAEKQRLYDQIRHDLGLDVPIQVQFGRYLWKLVRGDMGKSYYHGRKVMGEIASRLPATIELGLLGIIFGMVLAIPLGVIGALRQDTWVDYLSRVVSVLSLSIPAFWTATLVIVVPGILWHYAPPNSYSPPWVDLKENLRHIVPPAIILGSVLMGSIARMTRATVLEVIRQDYVRTARAKGLAELLVIQRHVLKNSMIPVFTLLGLFLSILIGGAAIMEVIFNIPGVGSLTVNAVQYNDFPQLQANVLFISTWIVTANLLVDVTYGWLDPRIRYN